MTKQVYRFLALLSILSLLLVGAAAPTPNSPSLPWQAKVDPWVLQTATQGDTEFLVSLASQAGLSQAQSLTTKSEKGWYIFRTLTELASRTQAPLINVLDKLGVEYRPYWVTNAIWVRANMQVIQQLAVRSDVAHIYANPTVAIEAPVQEVPRYSLPQTVEWNIQKVNADDVWALGDTGQGVVVGGADTGYAWDHPAIKNQYRGWNGSTVDHNYNWFDATSAHSQTPVDPYGHGTHTMGTMVGDDGGSNQIGMAPGARWIGCRNMDSGGNGTPATYIACYQWFIAPTRVDGTYPNPDMAPDVINNSWGCTYDEGCTSPNILLSTVQSVVAAGIVTVHSAGNSGSACSTVSEPAAIYEESFTVGATTSTDGIASFSSRGPVTADGSNRLKPDISAPGVGVRSSIPGGGYASYSGTSMAGPHVAGLVALLISAKPTLRGQVSQIKSIAEQAAQHIFATGCSSAGVPNNIYGWGRIDALAAVQALHSIQLNKVASAPLVMPGDLITYTLTITHDSGINPTTNVVLNDTIPGGASFVSATSPYTHVGNVIQWDFSSLAPMQVASVDMIVQVDSSARGSITNTTYSVHSDQVATVYGTPVVTSLGELSVLALDKKASSQEVFPGDFITYTLTITHESGTSLTTNVVLTDTLPTGTSFVSASVPYYHIDDNIRWDFASMGVLEIRSVTLTVRADITSSGMITNDDYLVSSDQVLPVYGDPVYVEVEKLDILRIQKIASAPLVFPGDLITYTLLLTDSHPVIPATGVDLVDTLPLGTHFISATGPYTLDGDVIRWDFLLLNPQGSDSVNLVVKVNRGMSGSLVNINYAAVSDQSFPVFGDVVITPVGSLYYLPLLARTP